MATRIVLCIKYCVYFKFLFDLSVTVRYAYSMKIKCSLKGCRKKFEPVKEWQKFCSKACKQKAYRLKRAEKLKADK